MPRRWQAILHAHLSHWMVVLLLTGIGLWVGSYIDHNNLWTDVRYAATQKMFQQLRKPLYPKRTAIVLIGDEEYWLGELAGRSPIRRDYLGRLVDALDKAGAQVIALDFDLRSPEPDGSVRENPAYIEETKVLASSINSINGRAKVILATSIGLAPDGDGYVSQANVYDGLISAPIERGYVQLPYDVRRVPLPMDVEDRSGNQTSVVDSFSTAIVKSVDLEAYRRTVDSGSDELPFASYIAPSEFANSSEPKLLRASKLLRDPSAASKYLSGKIVIVSGDWNSRAFGVGPRVDMHASPVGLMPGAMIHANYVESMLNDQVFRPIPEWLAIAAEVLMVLVLSVVAFLGLRLWVQMATMIGITLLILLASFFLQDLGRFVDFFIPLIIVLGHRVIEKILEWRREAVEWRKEAPRRPDHAHA